MDTTTKSPQATILNSGQALNITTTFHYPNACVWLMGFGEYATLLVITKKLFLIEPW